MTTKAMHTAREILLLNTLEEIERVCGIRKDFVPIGLPFAVAQIIKDARNALKATTP